MSSRRARRDCFSRARAASAGLAALLALALTGASGLAADALYQWTDAQGNTRYTPDPDRIPSGQRASMRRLEPGMPTVIAPARAAAEPAQAPAPQAEPTPAIRESAPAIAAPSAPAPAESPAPAPAIVATPMAAPVAPPAPAAVAPPLAAPPASSTASTGSVARPDATTAAVRPPRPTPAAKADANPTASSDASPDAVPTAPATAADAAREQELNAAIASDQEKLKAMLAAPELPGETALVDSAELREIARRLPELQAELRALRERQTPPAGP